MKNLFFLFLCVPTIFAAVGDSTLEINTSAWDGYLYVNGGTTNGTIVSGLKTNNFVTGNEKLVLTVNSPGYAFTHVGGVVTQVYKRTIYGTLRVRFPYSSGGAEAFPDVTISGSDAKVRISLSSPIFLEDVVTSAVLAQGFYTSSGATNNANALLSVTNSSAQSWGLVKAGINWTKPGWNRETNTTMTLKAVGFHSFSEDTQSLEVVRFTTIDESGDSVVVYTDQMEFDPVSKLVDLVPFGEYIGTIPLTSFTALDQLQSQVCAFPKYGITNSVHDSNTTGHSMPTPLLANITNLYDPNQVYSKCIGVVSWDGADATGVVRTNTIDPTSIPTSEHFFSINGFMAAAKGTNNAVYGHNDSGGAIAFVRTGITNWTGGTASTSGTPKSWVIITNYPGDSVTLTNDNGNDDISDRIWIHGSNINLEFITTTIPFSGIQALRFTNLRISSSGTAPFQAQNIYAENCRITNIFQGLRAFGGGNTSWALIRGCDISGVDKPCSLYTFVGNYHNGTTGANYTLAVENGSWGTPGPERPIVYNNFMDGFGANATSMSFFESSIASTNGGFLVQNAFLYVVSNTNPGLSFSGTLNTRGFTNLLIAKNIFIGKRNGFFYNDAGSAEALRVMCFMIDNIYEIGGWKADTFSPPNANRVGGWQNLWGSGSSGNFRSDAAVDQAAGAFFQEFCGMHSFQIGSVNDTGRTNIVNLEQFIQRGAYAGAGATTGGGRYSVKNSSPTLLWTKTRPMLKFDISGNYRGISDPPGIFAISNPRWAGANGF